MVHFSFAICSIKTKQYVSKGFLEPLSERITADLEECYVQGWKNSLSYDGEIYTLPKSINTHMLMTDCEKCLTPNVFKGGIRVVHE